MVRMLPGAIWRPVSYRTAAHAWPHTPLGWILHVTVMNGSPFGVFEHAPSDNRRFSHAWVSKTGVLEQYQDLDLISWAQVAGNSDYYSIETEGFPNEPLTSAQIATLARCHNALGTVDQVINSPGARGIGTHSMGGVAYGNHDCPGSVRAAQRSAIIAAAHVSVFPPNTFRWTAPLKYTVEVVAAQFKVTVDELQAVNHDNVRAGVLAGVTINVPFPKGSKRWTAGYTYTADSVARRFGVTVDELQAVNPDNIRAGILKGVTINVPLTADNASQFMRG